MRARVKATTTAAMAPAPPAAPRRPAAARACAGSGAAFTCRLASRKRVHQPGHLGGAALRAQGLGLAQRRRPPRPPRRGGPGCSHSSAAWLSSARKASSSRLSSIQRASRSQRRDQRLVHQLQLGLGARRRRGPCAPAPAARRSGGRALLGLRGPAPPAAWARGRTRRVPSAVTSRSSSSRASCTCSRRQALQHAVGVVGQRAGHTAHAARRPRGAALRCSGRAAPRASGWRTAAGAGRRPRPAPRPPSRRPEPGRRSGSPPPRAAGSGSPAAPRAPGLRITVTWLRASRTSAPSASRPRKSSRSVKITRTGSSGSSAALQIASMKPRRIAGSSDQGVQLLELIDEEQHAAPVALGQLLQHQPEQRGGLQQLLGQLGALVHVDAGARPAAPGSGRRPRLRGVGGLGRLGRQASRRSCADVSAVALLAWRRRTAGQGARGRIGAAADPGPLLAQAGDHPGLDEGALAGARGTHHRAARARSRSRSTKAVISVVAAEEEVGVPLGEGQQAAEGR